MNYDMLPEHCREGMQRYIEEHVEPGSFLCAVIRNNLVDAFKWADETNREHLFDYAVFLYNEAPESCWGSDENMRAWLNDT